MASYQELIAQLDKFPQLVVLKHYEADAVREHEYQAAVRLQGWFRGYRVRDQLRQLYAHAVVLQRHWRGYLGRRDYRRRLQDTVLKAQSNHYRRMATLIQKTWRGFRSRLYVFNFADWKGYLSFVRQQNSELGWHSGLEKRRLEEERRTVCSSEIQQQVALVKAHHLVSTKAIPGVYNSPYHREQAGLDRTLASIRLAVAPRPKQGTSPEARPDAEVTANKLQGPFLPPLQLQKHLQRPPCRSVRAAEPFESVHLAEQERLRQEQMRCVSDEPFRPPKARLFPPLLSSVHAGVPYSKPPGYRDSDPARFLTPEGFRRVLRPVATFDGCPL